MPSGPAFTGILILATSLFKQFRLRLFAKKRLQQKQRSRHASASFKWGISRIQPAKMLLGPPCAWPDQCRENGRAYRDGWRDGSCNVLHCSTRAFFGPWMGWCVVLALITWHFNCDSTWIVKPWSTRLGALANDVSSRGLPQGRCCRCCPPCLCRRTFCLFCPRLPTQTVIIRMKTRLSRLITYHLDSLIPWSLIFFLQLLKMTSNKKVQEFQIIFAKEIDRYLAKLGTRGKTSAGWSRLAWYSKMLHRIRRSKGNCGTQTVDLSWFYDFA